MIRSTGLALAIVAGILSAGAAGTAANALPAQADAPTIDATPPSTQEMLVSPGCYGQTLPRVCSITEPVVDQAQATYPLLVQPGNRIIVFAGGCVQTGGRGKTWKRYVDPASNNDLYHGLITIPGATGSLVRLSSVVGNQLVVGGSGGYLTLGYQDDDYSDNGYDDPDNGTGNQCLNTGNAYVTIVVS